MLLATTFDTIGKIAVVVAAGAALVTVVFAYLSARAGKKAAEAAHATVQVLQLARRDAELNVAATSAKEALRRLQRWASEAEAFHKRMAAAITRQRQPSPEEIPYIGEELDALNDEFCDLDLATMVADLDNWRRELLLEDEVVEAVRVAEKTATAKWTGIHKIIADFIEQPSRTATFVAFTVLHDRFIDPNPWPLAHLANFCGEVATAISRSQRRITSPKPVVVSPDDRRNINWLTASDAGTWKLHAHYRDRALAGFTKP